MILVLLNNSFNCISTRYYLSIFVFEIYVYFIFQLKFEIITGMAVKSLNNGKNTQSKNITSMREWSPLTELLERIPLKVQNGIFPQYVKFTCIDVLPEYLVIGTNMGMLFWCDRNTKDIQRLRCENSSAPITAVKVISTVDYMVASGSKDGNVSIFQIPKPHPDCIPDTLKPKHKKKIERYTVSELHKSEITAIEWSKNGMKLFSGDKNGCIVYTEIDFYMHICKSLEILNETYKVVQLSYIQQRLLVSTTYRSIICQKLDKWKVCQVGKKDRKVLGNFGGIIYQHSLRSSDSILYCTRPGLRIWISDVEGDVQKTLLFKDLLSKDCPEVPIINPISRTLQALKPHGEPNFGILLLFKDNFLVTWNNDIVYILNPQEMCVLYKMSYLRSVLSIATCKDEIFILEEERNIIRIAEHPETLNESVLSPSINSVTNSAASIKTLTSKLHSAPIISAIPPLFEHAFGGDNVISSDYTSNMVETNVEEAREIQFSPSTSDSEKNFDSIGKQDFNDRILFKKSKQRRKSMSASVSSSTSTSSEEKDATYIRPTIMNLSTIGVLPDLRSPESIKNDIEYKEKILEDILNLDKIKLPTVINLTPDKQCEERNECEEDKLQYNNSRLKISDSEKIEDKEHLHKEEPSNRFVCDAVDSKLSVKKDLTQKNCVKSISKDEPVSVQVSHNLSTFASSSNCDVHRSDSGSHDIPDCYRVPSDWKLSEIYLKATKEDALSDTSLNDWEIV